jgi:streptomycin 6-kinase
MSAAYDDYEQRCLRDAEWEQRDLDKPPPAGIGLLPQARAAADRLIASTAKAVLLHGDFIDKNLLFDGSGYVATDPIPRTGDPCSDIGFFAAYHPPASGLLDTAAAIARTTGEDVDRAVLWASVWAVGEACETWRSDSDDLQTVVRAFDL